MLLRINGVMFISEAIIDWFAESTGLLADSLDMLADALVYGIAFSAVGRGHKRQSTAATISGVLQIALGLGVLFEVVRRSLYGSEPVSGLMMGAGVAALIANAACLAILTKHRNGGAHMRASWIFSTDDVIANLGVIESGVLVLLLGSAVPDLVIGAMISVVVVRGGTNILQGKNRDPSSSGESCVYGRLRYIPQLSYT